MSRPMRFYLNKGVEIFMVIMIVLAFLGGMWFLRSTMRETMVVVEQYEYNSQVYTCTHYANGDMECEQVGDPEVGGGRMQP